MWVIGGREEEGWWLRLELEMPLSAHGAGEREGGGRRVSGGMVSKVVHSYMKQEVREVPPDHQKQLQLPQSGLW